MFYKKTFAQRTVIPLLGLIPLFVSISTFVYDYYSDIELTLEYYRSSNFSWLRRETFKQCGIGDEDPECPHPDPIGDVGESGCYDIRRTPHEFRIALVTNIVCICLPIAIFYAMCARELLPFVHQFLRRHNSMVGAAVAYPLWILLALVCAPFFILYVAARQVYYRFRHRRAKHKNLFRRKLQKSEYFWGISRTAEAGLESCGQLILQVSDVQCHTQCTLKVMAHSCCRYGSSPLTSRVFQGRAFPHWWTRPTTGSSSFCHSA